MKAYQQPEGHKLYRDLSQSVLKGTFSKGVQHILFPKEVNSERFKKNLFPSNKNNSSKKRIKEPAPTYGNWDKFMLNNAKNEMVHKKLNVATKRLIENSETSRTILKWTEKEINKNKIITKKKKENFQKLKSSATGSISNLIAVTPLNEKPKKQLKRSASTEIFNLEAAYIKGKKMLSKNASFSSLPFKKTDLKEVKKSMKITLSKKEKLKSLNQSLEEKPVSRVRLVKGGAASNEQSIIDESNDKKRKGIRKYSNHSNNISNIVFSY